MKYWFYSILFKLKTDIIHMFNNVFDKTLLFIELSAFFLVFIRSVTSIPIQHEYKGNNYGGYDSFKKDANAISHY